MSGGAQRRQDAGFPEPEIPESLWKLMAELGPRWPRDIGGHTKRIVAAFDELHARAPKLGHRELDVRYGNHERHRLDIYLPPREDGAGPDRALKPVLMFVHGGAFVDGDKNRSDQIYANVLWFAARHGMIGVNVEFRLAPESMFPGGTEDIAAAVHWVRQHIADKGGDPQRIILMGHSAGATHAGHFAGDARFHRGGDSGLAGLVLVSGRVRVENSAENPNASKVEAYYGTDQRLMAEGSPVTYADRGLARLPIMLAVAQYENPLIDLHNTELYYALAKCRRRAPRFAWLSAHNHSSSIAHLNTADPSLSRPLLDFVRHDMS